ncbi:PREDICTED: leucine-rich repeats and immunoglobulin-like domains protein 2 isoform X2 [Nicrophorus vespilloides]|uniref:Leucine-rich repeats and immunoglobulin-like domains protein 2 isoform X2 n=1 Tax=Nicrophorus vespilloides TaxID=110193 RepID=A0ABM1MQF1_NICVS|nr:PREDICTED: leucine-rich repeats and immunoglobulin-like domains protein 2 isoform X2 [Nicrophorus vespilloides]
MLIRILILSLFTTLCFGDCNFDEITKLLKCNNIKAEAIVSKYFNVKQNVARIYWENCEITKLEANVVPFEQTQFLKISCGIREINPNTFVRVNNIIELDLSNNKISRITNQMNPPREAFTKIAKLKELNLSQNRITNIGTAVLDMPKLQNLYLNNNGIFVLLADTFEELRNAKIIDISNNDIPDLSGVFNYTKDLEVLKLSNNPVQKIDVHLFKVATLLKELDMSNCQLDNLQLEAFTGINNLEKLKFSNNPIKQIQQGLFEQMTKLQEISISNISISSLTTTTFQNNNMLNKLDLSNNQLSNLDEGIFANTQLEYLNVSNNKLELFRENLFRNRRLKVLDLSNNGFENIDVLVNQPLQMLYVRGNKIDYIGPQTLPRSLEYLDITENRLIYIEDSLFEQMPKLRMLEFLGNPLACACFNNILTALSNKSISFTKGNYFDGISSFCVVYETFHCVIKRQELKKFYYQYELIKNDVLLDTVYFRNN